MTGGAPPPLRVGQGFDAHRFGGDRPLVIGGVVIPGQPGLEGHSDADVVAHALADAILGGFGGGDLGSLFPASDPAWAGADSIDLLSQVVERAATAGWRTVNADCTVICERPQLAPHMAGMARRLSEAVDAPVAVAPKRAEGLGALGRVEGIACLAAVLLWQPSGAWR